MMKIADSTTRGGRFTSATGLEAHTLTDLSLSLHKLLQELDKVFEVPKGLPPPRGGFSQETLERGK